MQLFLTTVSLHRVPQTAPYIAQTIKKFDVCNNYSEELRNVDESDSDVTKPLTEGNCQHPMTGITYTGLVHRLTG
jgi:hypothetical protein